MDAKAGVLSEVCAALLAGNPRSAKETLARDYPFKRVEKTARAFSVRRSMDLFMRDGFIDHYTGNRLINPGVLRLLHVVLGDDFPAHPNGKLSETHLAFWELFPTVDHLVPVSRGGRDDESNWVTASMLRNQAKGHWTVDDLGWTPPSAGAVKRWDGLSQWLIDYLDKYPTVLEQAAEPHRAYIGQWLKVTRAALEADG